MGLMRPYSLAGAQQISAAAFEAVIDFLQRLH